MRKHIFMPPALALLLGGCGIYTSYPPTTEVPKGLFGEEAATLADTTATLADKTGGSSSQTPSCRNLLRGDCTTTPTCSRPSGE